MTDQIERILELHDFVAEELSKRISGGLPKEYDGSTHVFGTNHGEYREQGGGVRGNEKVVHFDSKVNLYELGGLRVCSDPKYDFSHRISWGVERSLMMPEPVLLSLTKSPDDRQFLRNINNLSTEQFERMVMSPLLFYVTYQKHPHYSGLNSTDLHKVKNTFWEKYVPDRGDFDMEHLDGVDLTGEDLEKAIPKYLDAVFQKMKKSQAQIVVENAPQIKPHSNGLLAALKSVVGRH